MSNNSSETTATPSPSLPQKGDAPSNPLKQGLEGLPTTPATQPAQSAPSAQSGTPRPNRSTSAPRFGTGGRGGSMGGRGPSGGQGGHGGGMGGRGPSSVQGGRGGGMGGRGDSFRSGTAGGGGRGGERTGGGDRRAERTPGAARPSRDGSPKETEEKYEERVVDISRVSKVVKGGRHFGFRALVVVGDGSGSVGMGIGRAREVTDAIRKGVDQARKHMIKVPIVNGTIPHNILTKFGAAKVFLKPASPGTGVIAGGGVRAVLEAAGVRDVLTKSQGSSNVINVVGATIKGLQDLKDIDLEAVRRGKSLKDVSPFWRKKSDA